MNGNDKFEGSKNDSFGRHFGIVKYAKLYWYFIIILNAMDDQHLR